MIARLVRRGGAATVWKIGSWDMSGSSPGFTSSAVVMASVVLARNVQAFTTSLHATHFLHGRTPGISSLQ